MTEKFESKNVNRQAKILKYCGVVLIAISVIKIVFINHFNFKELGEFADSIIWLIGGSFALYISESQKMKDSLDQFIEWNDKKVIYRLAGQKLTEEIELNLIKHVSVSSDKINLTTKDNSIHTLDISDFKDFEERKKIKLKFENIKIN